MDCEDVSDLMTYWESHPPVHLMVAAYLGVKPKDHGDAATPTRDDIQALVKMFGGGG